MILFETAAGYALFRTDKPKKLEKVENLSKYMEDVEQLKKLYLPYYTESLWKTFISLRAQLMRSSAFLNL